MVSTGAREQPAHRTQRDGSMSPEAVENELGRWLGMRADHARLGVLLGAFGAVLIVAALVVAPGWPVYSAVVAGIATGCAGTAWVLR
jgi:Flp pilus assembly protein TadB